MDPNSYDSVTPRQIEADLDQVRGEILEIKARLAEKVGEETRLIHLSEAIQEYLNRRKPRSRAVPLPVAPGIVEYAEEVLRTRPTGEGLETNPLLELMGKAGFQSTAKDPYVSVFGTLNRAAKREGGPIVKVDKKWALRDWYPDGVPVQDSDEEEE